MTTRGRWITGGLLLPTILLTLPGVANAQRDARADVYVSLGAGATGLDAGADWRIMRSSVGVGGEFGIGNLIVLSVFGSYHPFHRRPLRKVDPFAMVGLTAVSDLNSDARGISTGGGLTLVLSDRLGLRFDGFSFVPTSGDLRQSSRRTSPRYWGIRAGVAFRF